MSKEFTGRYSERLTVVERQYEFSEEVHMPNISTPPCGDALHECSCSNSEPEPLLTQVSCESLYTHLANGSSSAPNLTTAIVLRLSELEGSTSHASEIRSCLSTMLSQQMSDQEALNTLRSQWPQLLLLLLTPSSKPNGQNGICST